MSYLQQLRLVEGKQQSQGHAAAAAAVGKSQSHNLTPGLWTLDH